MFSEACLMHLIIQDQQFNQDQRQHKNQKQEISIQNYLIYYQSSLITRSLNQIQSLQLIEDKEAPFNILNEIFVVYGGFDYLENELKTVIHTLNICYDKYYLQSFQFYIPAYLNFFKNFMEFWQNSKKDLIKKLQIEDQFDDQPENLDQDQDQNQSEEQLMYNQQLKVSNYIRQIIMRIQPLILNQNKVISVQSVQIFQLSAPLLFKQRMQVEQHDQNFSTNDANNVIIPDALGAITVEMLNIFKFV
ncbi:hypothetical protein PPERSA_11677 [Pseudocohnilembus persalinus]|uniref:Uncharacterized protein n=1 Tax=Pseudocohnilembus persalinus TaxID=266149 RepID=A0A0V0QAI1_PSEPJ|nr:hypothetical protein PPERSA_11677 [Pseudocohnilembus persalinus]|eukprot:KRW99076.1 hypothetical protein PPERSA_11677 [Pseudocohnilembus persalinus]